MAYKPDPQSPDSRAELRTYGEFLWDRELSRSVDQLTSDTYGIASNALMEVAGRAVAQAVLDADGPEATVIVLAGTGNNGGDALVAARWLADAGCKVRTLLVSDSGETKLSPLCAAQLQTARRCGVPVDLYKRGALNPLRRSEPIIIDGIYGLGFHGTLAEGSMALAALQEAAQLREKTVIAIDIPSGLDCDSGTGTPKAPLPADLTITFGGRKPAHILAPARDACGEIVAVAIGFPTAAQEAAMRAHPPVWTLAAARELLVEDPWSDLPRSANKYDRGHVLVIGGSPGKTGAPLLSAMAALRAGAGWATVAMSEAARRTLSGDIPRELVFEDLFRDERLNSNLLAKFLQERRVRAVVIGPGCMQTPLDKDVVAELAAYTSPATAAKKGQKAGFVVLDAGATHDALALLAGQDLDPDRWILTPHPGEWQKLGGDRPPAPLDTANLQAAQQTASKLGVSLLYKHATPILLTGHEGLPAFISNEGTAALARAGSGDMLAGTIAAHGAIGFPAALATLRAQAQIAWAARLAATDVGEQAVLAEDILSRLGRVAALAQAEDEDEADD